MAISVIIPAYNAGEHIGRAIESVLAQSMPADEIIVIDDGSTDNTRDEVEKFGNKATYIHQENAGASVARNTGIAAATGEWVAFLDADDEWVPEMLETQTELLGHNPDLVWSTANYTICQCDQGLRSDAIDSARGRDLLNGKTFFEDYFRAFSAGAAGCTITMIIKKDALIEAGLFTPGQLMANDLDMWWRIAYHHPKIGYAPQPLAIYHIHVAGSITKRFRDPQILSDLIERHLKIAAEFGRTGSFEPYAEHLLRYWIHKYFFDERIACIRPMAKRFGHILPPCYKTMLKILTIFPKVTSTLLPILRKINKVLRLPI